MRIVVVPLVCCVLAACGGGSSDEPVVEVLPPPAQAPAPEREPAPAPAPAPAPSEQPSASGCVVSSRHKVSPFSSETYAEEMVRCERHEYRGALVTWTESKRLLMDGTYHFDLHSDDPATGTKHSAFHTFAPDSRLIGVSKWTLPRGAEFRSYDGVGQLVTGGGVSGSFWNGALEPPVPSILTELSSGTPTFQARLGNAEKWRGCAQHWLGRPELKGPYTRWEVRDAAVVLQVEQADRTSCPTQAEVEAVNSIRLEDSLLRARDLKLPLPAAHSSGL